MKRWTEEEVESLKQLSRQKMPDVRISAILGRSARSIRAKRERLRIFSAASGKRSVSSANARCPFFEHYGKERVCCSADDQTSVTLSFKSARFFEDFAQNYCQNKWEECYIAAAITKHFEEDLI